MHLDSDYDDLHHDPLTKRTLACYDQAAARGIPASKIIPGIERKLGVRRSRVIGILLDHHRIRSFTHEETPVVWSAQPAPAAARAVEHQTLADVIQAGVDYAVAHGLMDADEIAVTTPTDLFYSVAIALRSGGQQNAA